MDEAIVGLWQRDKQFAKKLPRHGEYPAQLSRELKKAAHRAKHECNPRPGNTPEEGLHLLRNPRESQRASAGAESIKLPNTGNVKPPILTPADFDLIMPEFLEEIEQEIKYLLPTEGDLHSINKVIFAGGSCYIRQVIQFIVEKFHHLDISKDILFHDPENAISFGAVEYQREKNKGNTPINTTLSMSTYLQVDYNHEEDIDDYVKKMAGVHYFRPSGQSFSFIELARKGQELRATKPYIGGNIFSLALGARVLYIPSIKKQGEVVWKIFQVRGNNPNGKDYEEISADTQEVDEIRFTLNHLEKAIPLLSTVRLIYDFDIYGDFYRNIRIGQRLWDTIGNLNDKNPDLVDITK